jgi:glutamate synthase (ferredoxin)
MNNSEGNQRRFPRPQGLYHPQYEHDACGMGFVAQIQGRASHSIIQKALTILQNLDHRGARGAEINTGDGAGILFQLPHRFFQHLSPKLNFHLPEPGDYGVGMLFLPHLPDRRHDYEQQLTDIIQQEGQTVLGWRTVPAHHHGLGEAAIAGEPFIRQVFIGRGRVTATDPLAFERQLYLIRQRAEHEISHRDELRLLLGLDDEDDFYIASLSSRTIVYKGMLTTHQLQTYYPDLNDPHLESGLALVHSRFSTNTFPSWKRAHPYRRIIHNGEINTLRGNVNWLKARQALFASPYFGGDLAKIFPVMDEDGSDSTIFDNVLELLTLSGYSLPQAILMMIPEPWSKDSEMAPAKRAFYQYHSALMEPWDGPASIGFTDGTLVGAVLDRNGLRPSRYTITSDGLVILASETGVLDIPAENVVHKGRLQPGRMFLVDTAAGRIISDEEIKQTLAAAQPYEQWLTENMLNLAEIKEETGDWRLETTSNQSPVSSLQSLSSLQHAFGYTFEDIRLILEPMAQSGVEPLGSMGDDTPHAVLSQQPQLLYNYFKQLFAQVTNPPIDALREEIITSTETLLGSEGNLLQPEASHCRRIRLEHPILQDEELARLRYIDRPGFQAVTLPMLFSPQQGGEGLEKALAGLFAAADSAISQGANLLILSDREMSRDAAAIPALLATSGLHHHLIHTGQRARISLIVESGEPREVHHFASLLGYGADAINPYLAFATICDILHKEFVSGATGSEGAASREPLAVSKRMPAANGQPPTANRTHSSVLSSEVSYAKAIHQYVKATAKGIVKILSKMGISTIQSYRGAQIYEALGLHPTLIHRYFRGTPSRIGGIGLNELAEESLRRHSQAFPARPANGHTLPVGGRYQYREEGEYHLFNPSTIHDLQQAVRHNDLQAYQRYAAAVNTHDHQLSTLRGLLRFKTTEPIPLEEVESADSIVRRFKTGAMSYGSISQEAHESLAIAMNRLGGKSNTGEGGEDPARYVPDANGDSRNSAIKQVASGRFGVTSHYLVNAQEIQIKMAQGAKPGEGGQLPGHKVYPWIAKVRHATPGVGLISPPPHHDIYSIEDLAQLIYDLKNANAEARINVKLVSEVGVGTIAAGVAKGKADVILISGHDGGTGAAPQTSIKHTGLPWELGLAEAHQTLLLNNLRGRVTLETDGQLKTGRDVIVAALLGAEEFGFATAPLVSLGCIMMRVCHLDTCPVGIATQNPELRQRFTGDPQHVVNFMRFIAEDVRQLMAELGIRRFDDLIGRTDLLEMAPAIDHWKAQGLDLSAILHQPDVPAHIPRHRVTEQDHQLDETLDQSILLTLCEPALKHGEPLEAYLPIRNIHRTVGTQVGSAITRRYGPTGLPDDTIRLRFVGSAGQSFGAFIPRGLTMTLEGDANDYLGKGLSGGKIIVFPPARASFAPEKNVIIGNVAFYGATAGEAYIHGLAGERFAVRNSGVEAVVEGVGDHGCEYMTGGRVVILGPTGRNFAAGMSGGIAYVLDERGDFARRCNLDMVVLESIQDEQEFAQLRDLIWRHTWHTGSRRGWAVLGRWEAMRPQFVRVVPKDYRRVQTAIRDAEQIGLHGDAAIMAAFEANKRSLARVGGN